jgi:hypothetical protein
MWYLVRNLLCTVTIDSVLPNSKTWNPFLAPVLAIVRHDCPLAVKPGTTPVTQSRRNYLPVGMLPSAVSVLVVVLPSSEVPEGLMNYPAFKT